MELKNIQKELTFSKIFVYDKSKEIQKKLFELGFSWSKDGTIINDNEYYFLYIADDLKMRYSKTFEWFIGDESHKFVSADYILSINIDYTFKSGDLIVDNEGTLHVYKDGDNIINTFISAYPKTNKFLVERRNIEKSFILANDTDKKLFIKILKDAGFIWNFNDKKLYSSVTNKIVNNAYPEDQLAKLLSALFNKGFYWDGESIKEFK